MRISPPFVIESSTATFRQDAIERSAEVPVVVDFWAPWCGPCRVLGPVLETLAEEFGGRFLLVKLNTEAAPEIAEAFGIRSIPAVFGIRDGKVVDSFVGALPEAAARSWIEGLMPTAVETLMAEGERLEASDPGEAETRYQAALAILGRSPETERDPRGMEAAIQARLARVLLAQGRLDESRAHLDRLEARGYLEPEAERVKAELDLRSRGGAAGDLDARRAAVAANPGDHTARLHLAEALAAARQYEEALAIFLDLVETDRKQTGESARKLMLEVFQLLPGDSTLVADYRRRLAAALF